MQRRMILILCIGVVLAVVACGNQNTNLSDNKKNRETIQQTTDTDDKLKDGQETNQTTETGNTNEEQKKNQMIITINGQQFQVDLYDNETVNALKEKLPMTLSMDELHGNEKYIYLDESLPTSTENIGTIKTGDIMLFGSDCLVVFYKSFDTSYSYTKIGHIANETELANALGSGTAEITFSAE